MADTNEGDSSTKERGLRKFAPATAVVLVLSLATWLFFYLEAMPLKPAETTVVVGCWLGVTLMVKWILGRVWKKNKAGEG